MHVLLINQTYYPDVAATAQHAHDLARHLAGRGHRVSVIASRSIYGRRGSNLPARETVEGIEIHRVGMSLFGKSRLILRVIDFALFYMLAAARALLIRRVDVVIPFTTPPFIALVGWMLRLVKRCKYVYWVMDLYPDLPVACGVMKPTGLATRFFQAVNRLCLRRADRAVVLGRCMQERVIGKGVPAATIARIGVWADHREINPVPRDENPYRDEWNLRGKLVVMYSGNFGIGHDIDTIAAAIERLQRREDIAFVFVGSGKRMEEMKQFAEDHKLNNVQFHPYQPRERINASLSLPDVHLISLLDPVCGIMVPCKLYGIMAAERASLFVGPAGSEIARTLVEDEAGLTVACGDVDGLVQAIESLADDRARSGEMGRNARRALIQKYDRRHRCEQWEKLLCEVVGERMAAPEASNEAPAAGEEAPADAGREVENEESVSRV